MAAIAEPLILATREAAPTGLGIEVTSRTVSRTALHRHRRPVRQFGVVLAVLALALRLALPVPPALSHVEAGPLAAFGEHALCLAAPASIDPAPISRDKLPPPGSGHADHEHSLCCLWHASAAGFALLEIDTAAPIVFPEAIPLIAATGGDFRPASLTGPTRARGPPQAA